MAATVLEKACNLSEGYIHVKSLKKAVRRLIELPTKITSYYVRGKVCHGKISKKIVFNNAYVVTFLETTKLSFY